MIEPLMYFGIGFLVAALLGLVIIPLVHGRAVRLTMRRLEAATPLSMAEIQADKDQLRAEFAMSTRRLEVSVENLRAKSTSQLAELGKKGDAINRLKIELGEKTATIFALEARDKALRDQLRTTEEEFAFKTSAMIDAQRALSAKESDLARLTGTLDERSNLADAQKADIAGLQAQVETLKERLTGATQDLKAVEDRRDAERVELKAAAQELSEERGKVEKLGGRVAELEQALMNQTAEAQALGRRAQDLETRFTEQSRALGESENEVGHLRAELEKAKRVEADLRAAVGELDDRANSATKQLRSENSQLQTELANTKEHRDRIAREFGQMKRDAEESWASERVENALLRERINDVAAEVARLASALEGPNSPIDAILAAETEHDRGAQAGDSNASAHGEPLPGGNLADRIRALQSRASRMAKEDEPKVAN